MSNQSNKQREMLLEAIHNGDVEAVHARLAAGMETNFDVARWRQPSITTGRSLLHMLMYLRQMGGAQLCAAYLQIMRLLINEGGTDPDRVSYIGSIGLSLGLGNFGDTPLNHAASIGDVESAELLLQCGANPAGVAVVGESSEATAQIYSAALHCTAENDNEVVARLLIFAGADVNAAGIGGITPLQIANGRKHERVAALLRQAGARDP